MKFKIIEQTTIDLNATKNLPKETKPVDIWCDRKSHLAMIRIGDHYEFGGSIKCNCVNRKESHEAI